MQAYFSCKEGGKPGQKLTKKHINAIILLCYVLHVYGNKGPMLAALHEEVQKNTDKFKAPEVTDSEANKTPTAEPFAEKEEPVLYQGPTEV